MTFIRCTDFFDKLCPYCLDSFTKDNEPWAHETTHPYHYACIKKWVEAKKECPSCRAAVTIHSPDSLKEKISSYLKLGSNVFAASALASGYVYLITQEGGTSVSHIIQSRWIQAAMACAALSVQQEIGAGHLHRLRSLITATSVFVGINAGAAIGATAHSTVYNTSESSLIGALVGFGATLLAGQDYSSPRLVATSSAITGLVSALFAGSGVKESLAGTIAGAATGALAIGFSAISIPVVVATARFLHRRFP